MMDINGYLQLGAKLLLTGGFLIWDCRVLNFQEGKEMLKLPLPSARYFFFAVIFSAVAVKATSELELRAVSMES